MIQTRSARVNTMAEYVNNNVKVVSIGDEVGIDIPKPIASINFDARYAGTYVVYVKQDGSYFATFVGTTYENKLRRNE